MPELTKTEATELVQHERTINAGLRTFGDVGLALLAIRDGKLYRAAHKTFESYCKARWGWERRHAYRLIDAAETAACVQLDTKPANEAQARPLSALPKEERATAWETVIERAPKDESGQPKVTAPCNSARHLRRRVQRTRQCPSVCRAEVGR
jgi:hypothetical protein